MTARECPPPRKLLMTTTKPLPFLILLLYPIGVREFSTVTHPWDVGVQYFDPCFEQKRTGPGIGRAFEAALNNSKLLSGEHYECSGLGPCEGK